VTVTTPEALGFEVFARLAAELGRRLRIGSLFTGYGGLDLAVEEVTGGEVVWVCDPDPGARQILAYRYPGVPNLGDITRMRDPLDPEALGELFDLATSWADVTPVDVLCGGFPCQDVSSAGRRAGLAGARSGLWAHFARAIAELRPRFVVIENVYGLLGAKAGRSADALDPDLAALLEGDAADPADAEVLAELETLVHEHQEGTDAEAAADLTGDDVGSDDGDMGDGDARPVLLRAMGAVLGDLSDLGYDATWITVAASDVGAPHRRRRVFILAWDAAYPAGAGRRPEGRGTGDGAGPAGVGSPEPDGCGRATTADALREAGGGGTGLREAGPGRVGRGRPDDGRVPSGEHGEPADADDPRREGAESAGRRLVPAGAVERMIPSDPDLLPTPRASEGPKGSPNQRGSSGDLMLTSAILQLPEEAATPLLPTPDAAVFNDGQTPEAWEARHARELTKGYNGNGGGTPLAGVVQFLPTPEASDATGGRTATELGGTRTSGTKRAITLGAAVSPRLLPTPVVTDAASSGSRASGEDAKAHPGTSLTDALVRDAAPPAPTRPTSTTPADSAQATAEGHAPPSGGDRLMATPRVASERTSRHAATSRENRSAPSLAQSAEIAAGILPREFDSWDDLPASWRPAETTTTAGSAPTPSPSDDGRLF
jgi:site-specific DNA-cytosine methylase